MPRAVLSIALAACLLPSGAVAARPTSSAAPIPQVSADSAATGCRPSLAAGRQTLSLDVAGSPREVIVQVPALPPGQRPPALIAFHGYTAHAWQLDETSGLSDLADVHSFVAAFPEALGDPTTWHVRGIPGAGDRDIELTGILIAALVEQACADAERVYLAGHSMGGAMASDAACHLAEHVAGVVLVAALWFEPPCAPSRPVPVTALHALDDPVLPYGGGPLPGFGSSGPQLLAVEDAIAAWAAHDDCGGDPETADAADGSAVLTWSDCSAPVVLHRLPSGGHAWPAMASGLIVEMMTAVS